MNGAQDEFCPFCLMLLSLSLSLSARGRSASGAKFDGPDAGSIYLSIYLGLCIAI